MRSYFKRADPFFDEQENHSLIGVANVFLACLFYDVKLQYAVPIINQKGEVRLLWVYVGISLSTTAAMFFPSDELEKWELPAQRQTDS